MKVIRERPFFGPVSRDENHSAHGGVCVLEERESDGARRLVNVNGLHSEYGPWCGSHKARAHLYKEMRDAEQTLNSMRLLYKGDVVVARASFPYIRAVGIKRAATVRLVGPEIPKEELDKFCQMVQNQEDRILQLEAAYEETLP